MGVFALRSSCFQSHCGAIGTIQVTGTEGSPKVAFNPTVVRLGHGPLIDRPHELPTFQSHCGAIGTYVQAVGATVAHELSIPLWCDWDTPRHRTQAGLPAIFQSHCGAIGTGRRGWCRWCWWCWLSIPLWCDWDPTTGTLDAGRPPAPFQSHCGAIGTPQERLTTSRPLWLSIPLWCDWDAAPGTRAAAGCP